jgi:hypothetical protein
MSKNIAATPRTPDEILTTVEAARFARQSPRTFEKLRCTGGGPPFLKPSPKCVRYLKSDVLKWLENSRRSSTSAGAEAAAR